MRNPDWVRDEIILAMDLYFRADRKQLPANHVDVIRLSQLLNALPIHKQSQRDEQFRNPNGISMILGNFLGIDPVHAQRGLSRNNHLQEKVWQDFVSRTLALRQTAEAIERFAAHEITTADGETLLAGDDVFPEGLLLTRLHIIRERNRVVVEKKKTKVLAEFGRLDCEVCGFDFAEVYGELGRGFAECHHTVPLAQAAFVRNTRTSDIAIVCANCHRMLHRAYPPMTIQLLRDSVYTRHGQGTNKACDIHDVTNLS